MELDMEPTDIWKTHRTGPRKPDKVRPVIVKVSYAAKDLIMEHLSQLKDRSNPKTNQKYFISEQKPEGVIETKKQVSSRLNALCDSNEKLPKQQQQNIYVVNSNILIDDQPDILDITTPQPSELFLDNDAQRLVDQAQGELSETVPETLRNSQFIGLAAHADSLVKVKTLYKAVMQ